MRRRTTVALALVAIFVGCTFSDLDGYSGGTAPPSTDGGCDGPCTSAGKDGGVSATCNGVTCPPHASCAIAEGKAACGCTSPYKNEDAGCVFAGGPLDPGFQDIPKGAWKLDPNVSILASAAGGIEPGYANFAGAAPNATVRQSFVMPTLTDSEPLAAVVSARVGCTSGSSCFRQYDLLFGARILRFNEYVTADPNAFQIKRHCLGEAAYGTTLDFAFRMTSTFSGTTLDHLGFEPAPDCPKPGSVVNGSFEAEGGWTIPAPAQVEIASGIGVTASRGLRLATTCCGFSEASTTVSVPQTTAKPALALSTRGAVGRLAVYLGGQIASFHPADTFEAFRVCLPEYTRGLALPVRLISQPVAPPAGCAPCNTKVGEMVVDDVTVVSEPSCGSPHLLADGTFENESDRSATWNLYGQYGGVTTLQTGTAHGGQRFARLALADVPCGLGESATALAVGTAPTPSATAGPGLRFFYRATPTGAKATAAVSNTSLAGGAAVGGAVDLPAAAAWTEKTLCIDPTVAGAEVAVQFVLAGEATCNAPSLDIDDVELTTIATCPRTK